MTTTAEGNGAGPGARAELIASLHAHLTALSGKLDAREAREDRRAALMRQVQSMPLPSQQITGTATVNMPDLHGPHDGYNWDIQRLTIRGMTGGTITCYNTLAADAYVLAQWTQDGTWSFRGEILNDSENLLFVGASVTGTATISGRVINVPAPLVPEYIL